MTVKRMQASQRRDQLLDVARDIVVADGFGGLTLDRVAREAGVTRPLIYAQFDGLPGLVTSLVDRETATALDQLLDVMSTNIQDQELADPVARAQAGFDSILHAADAAPLSWRILLASPSGGPPELYDRIRVGRALALSHVRDLVSHVADPELMAHIALTGAEELLRLHLDDPRTYPSARLLQQANIFLNQLLMTTHPDDDGRT